MTLVKQLIIKILNLKLVNIVRISKYKNIFGKCYIPNWSEEKRHVKHENYMLNVKGEIIHFIAGYIKKT